MKAILASTHPLYCTLISEGKKTIEVRKTRPKLEVPFKVYIYCTRPYTGSTDDRFYIYLPPHDTPKQVNGTVIGEFVCDAIRVYGYDEHIGYPTPAYEGDPSFLDCGPGYWITCGELKDTCLSKEEFEAYGNKKTLYGWHITDLVIYDKPRGLWQFHLPCNHKDDCLTCKHFEYFLDYNEGHCLLITKGLKRPPQSWCYVNELTNDT